MDGFADRLFAHLREHGYQTRIASVSHLYSLQKDIDEFIDIAKEMMAITVSD